MKRNREEMPKVISLIRPPRPVLPWRKRIGKILRGFWDDLRSQFSSNPLDRCRWVRLASSLKNVSAKEKDQLARAGEEEAVIMLREKGYVILQQNVRLPEGELDIVARLGSALVFFEVKTRRDREHGEPSAAVNAMKRQRQAAISRRFLSICRLSNIPVRFDIISILWTIDAPPEIKHIENAFQINDF